MKSGVVYQSGQEVGREVEIAKQITTLKRWAFILSKVGLGLIIVSVVGAVIYYAPVISALGKYEFDKRFGKQITSEDRSKFNQQMIAGLDELATWAVPDSRYSLFIPKIQAISRVIPNVDAASALDYQQALKLGVAEARGLSHPGDIGTTYLFSHSVGATSDVVRYNAVFYLLDKLEKGDEVEVVYLGKLYKYKVDVREVLEADDIRYLVPQRASERLVLQTCYPPGTTWKRLLVVAQRVGE